MSLNKSERLKILLQNGYFPPELPPPFTTRDFAKYRKSVKAAWPTGSEPNTTPEIFNVPRTGIKRRRLSIVNPISQYFLSELLSENWIEIKKFIDSSKTSLDKPILTGGIERAIPKPDFAWIDLKKIETAGEYDHILFSDISRFYGTIYTHAIPWAMYGKQWSKVNMFSAAFQQSLGNQLDVKVRKGMSNQTIGIPIGPDTSRIISEIIAVAIENRYAELSGDGLESVFRYVDDWFVGFNTSTESEQAISHLSRACTEFELDLNIEKTQIANSKNPTLSMWPEELLKLSKLSPSSRQQARDIKHFFEMAFYLASKHTSESVLDYALKVARGFNVDHVNYTLFESFVLKAMRASKNTFPVGSQIIVNYLNKGAPVNSIRVSKIVHDTITQSMPHGHTSEVAWALFLARETKTEVRVDVLDSLAESDNSVCILICLDLHNRGLIKGTLDMSHWKSLMTTGSLRDSNWLLAYEADLKGWLPSSFYPSHVDGDRWFRVLKQKGISFYDPKRELPTFRDSKRLQIHRLKRRSYFATALFGMGLALSSI